MLEGFQFGRLIASIHSGKWELKGPPVPRVIDKRRPNLEQKPDLSRRDWEYLFRMPAAVASS